MSKTLKTLIFILIFFGTMIIYSYSMSQDENTKIVHEVMKKETANIENEKFDQIDNTNNQNDISKTSGQEEIINSNSENIDEEVNSSQSDTQTEVKETAVVNTNTSNLPAGEDGNMIRLINETRAANGLNQLSYDSTLYSVADVRLSEISTYFSHTRPDGTPFYTVSSAVDGENLSKFGVGDALSSFTGFMNSQGHRENILYSGFTRVACKMAVIGGTVYWIQLFGY